MSCSPHSRTDRLAWRLVERCTRWLPSDDRDAVLGDLTEMRATGANALREIAGLIVRRGVGSGDIAEQVRKGLGALFTVLGMYYCTLGIFTLIRLPGVTTRWIERSGDPDFHFDYALFFVLSALGLMSIVALGWRTVVKGLQTARGRHTSWLGPAIAALPLHWFWFLYRIIGTGVLDRESAIAARRSAAVQFGAVCVGYVLLWLMSRRTGFKGPDVRTARGECQMQVGASNGFLRRAWQRKWLVGAATGAGAVAMLALSFASPPLYKSQALIRVQPWRVTPDAGPTAIPAATAEGLSVSTRASVLSRAQLERIIRKFGLYADERRSHAPEDIIERMRDRDIELTVLNDRRASDGYVFAISYASPSPQNAQQVAQTLANVFIEENIREQSQSVNGTEDLLVSLLEDRRRALDEYDATVARLLARDPGRPLPTSVVLDGEVLRERYKAVRMKVDDVGLTTRMEKRQIGESYRLVEEARIPNRPVGLARASLGGSGALGGLALGLVFAARRTKPLDR